MESNNKLKEIDIENRTCYYFDDIIKIKDFDFNNILINEKSLEKILVYDVSYKMLMESVNAKPVRIRFSKLNGFV